MSALTTANVGSNPPPDPNQTDLFNQQQSIGRLQAMAQQLRQAAQPQAAGTMVGGRYIPNYQGMAQQMMGNLYEPSAETQLTNAQAGFQRAQVGAAQQALSTIPTRAAPTQVDPRTGSVIQPTDENGNAIVQSFPEYQKALSQKAQELLQNPMTADVGKQMLTKLATGGYNEDEQKRLDSIRQQQFEYLGKTVPATTSAAAEIGKANIEQQTALIGQAREMAKFMFQYGPQNPENQAKWTSNIVDNLKTQGFDEYTKQMDAAQEYGNIYQDAVKNGFNATNSAKLIDAYMKAINPGMGVKEQQVKRIQNFGTWMDQIQNNGAYILGVQGKGVLPPNVAAQMNQVIQLANNDAKDHAYQMGNQAALRAQSMGIDPNSIIPDTNHRDPSAAKFYEYQAPTANPFGSATTQGSVPGTPPGTPTNPTPIDSKGNFPVPQVTNQGVILTQGGQPMPKSYNDPMWSQLEQQYGGKNAADLAKLRTVGERSNSDQLGKTAQGVETGAASPYQFTPGTRADIIKATGIDPLSGPVQAVQGASWLWDQKMRAANGDKVKAANFYGGDSSGGYGQRVFGSNAQTPGLPLTKQQKQQASDRSSSLPSSAAAPQGAIDFDTYMKQHG